MTIERASPVKLRIGIEQANLFVRNGIDFIAIPVLDESDRIFLVKMVIDRLNKIEKLAGEK